MATLTIVSKQVLARVNCAKKQCRKCRNKVRSRTGRRRRSRENHV